MISGGLSAALKNLISSAKVTVRYLFGARQSYETITEEYPNRLSARMPEDLPARYRGFLSNDISRCSGCRYCVDVCPVNCIRIETEPGPEKNQSWVSIFDIDHARCMFCGFCVDVCPTKSLVHTKEYEGAVFDLTELVHSYGKGFATPDMKSKWREEQRKKEEMAEELALMQKSPVSAELVRRLRSEEKKE
ncbi:MAG: 4Fe-4S binding protein [Bacteriovoracia bacterium]